jgi:hypothetical protein
MEEGYPFSGTGNVFRFVQGLISIRVLNNVIVVYDNDAEGAANFERTRQLNLPANVVVIKLPELACFEAFPTVGPNGQHLANINNRAAAIECYLDLPPDASVRWSSYNARIGAYQGELVEKERYARAFLDQRGRSTGFPVAEHAEAMAGSDEEILKWYCFWIATRTQLLGARRPSTKIEPVNITDPPKDFVVAGNVLTLRERNRPVVWENLRIKVDELPKAIEQLKALAGEHAGNM